MLSLEEVLDLAAIVHTSDEVDMRRGFRSITTTCVFRIWRLTW